MLFSLCCFVLFLGFSLFSRFLLVFLGFSWYQCYYSHTLRGWVVSHTRYFPGYQWRRFPQAFVVYAVPSCSKRPVVHCAVLDSTLIRAAAPTSRKLMLKNNFLKSISLKLWVASLSIYGAILSNIPKKKWFGCKTVRCSDVLHNSPCFVAIKGGWQSRHLQLPLSRIGSWVKKWWLKLHLTFGTCLLPYLWASKPRM